MTHDNKTIPFFYRKTFSKTFLNFCDYCSGLHQAIAADLNVDPQLLEAILKDIATAPIDERLRTTWQNSTTSNGIISLSEILEQAQTTISHY